jgi:glutathione peroxidase
MKKFFLLFSILAMTLTTYAHEKTIYDFKVTDIDGKPFDMASLKGKKVLIVNTASKCGFTPQYKQLEAIYKKYGPDKFVIVGFPANNFMHQEPGTNSQIKTFCTENYDVTFPMMSKISVKGDDMAPLYQWLTEKSKNGIMDAPIKWNFQKFMIDKTGHLVGVALPQDKPDSEKIISWIESKN